MKFSEFSKYLDKLEQTKSRNEQTVILADLISQITPTEGKYAMYLITGRLAPKFIDLEFNFSTKLLIKSLENLFDEESVAKKYAQLGDPGLLAEELHNEKKNNFKADYSVEEIYKKLKNLAKSSGKGSQEEKKKNYIEIFQNVDSISIKYVSRMIVGNLRLGISDKTMLDSLSWYISGDKSYRKILDQAFGNRADIGELTEFLKTLEIINEETILNNFQLEPGTPVASKLVEREKSPEAVWHRMPNCFVQPKLDGLRGQIHFGEIEEIETQELTLISSTEGKSAKIFSRNMENLTAQFPEITLAVSKLGVDSIILDAEIIGYDYQNEKYLPFQDTMTRRRKYDIKKTSDQIPVKAMCFDILYLNGKNLTQTPVEKRVEIMFDLFKNIDQNSPIQLLETKQMNSEEELATYFTQKVTAGLEGIITKEIGSNYEPGTRNFKWIKLKANTQSELVDTIDVVVLGFYHGKGARTKFGVGTLLAGIYDEENDQYLTLGKVGSGFTDENLEIIFTDLSKLIVNEKPQNYIVEKNLYPDVWVRPEIIMQIIADEITRSPNHTTAKGVKSKLLKDDYSKGLSIRFPRMQIWNRPDKDTSNTVSEIIRMYELRNGK